MARQTVPLTATQIKNAKPKDKKYKLSDGGKVYTWKFTTGDVYGFSTCRENFITNKHGIIVSWSYNGCTEDIRK